MTGPLTYISLFSSAGVGCYGFRMEGFACVATNELIERRLAVQKYNHKCKYDSGYILGDISEPAVKQRLFDEIALWKNTEQVSEIDVVIATPPCQGMSVANHKKTNREIIRNSLIVESVALISAIQPKIIVFENVPLFMRTPCIDTDQVERPIGAMIERNLGKRYSIYAQVVNFKNHGACSSRFRTLVLAVRRDLADYISPLELFPAYRPERTLRDCIGHMPSLTEFGEIDETDIFHNFRTYPAHMRGWISALSEGESAFDNTDENRVPHRVVNGSRVIHQRKNADKYRRQIWDKVGPCVHTRNDQLASQNTVHPADDRVFSLRELMLMMTVPADFRWAEADVAALNGLSYTAKRSFLKKHEMNIRQSLGEAVPTEIFRSIAAQTKALLGKRYLKDPEVRAEINGAQLTDTTRLLDYIQQNPRGLGFASLCRIVELANAKRNEQEAYFTNKSLITEMIKVLPEIDGETISIVEPSVGAGNFLPFLVKCFARKQAVHLTLVDTDPDALVILRALLTHIHIPPQVHITYCCADFLTETPEGPFDLVIGNPPFSKAVRGKRLAAYRAGAVNKLAVNTSAFFLEKALSIGRYTAMVMPKFLLNTPEFAGTRDLLAGLRVDTIIDFGERGFGGVLIETVALCVNPGAKPAATTVISLTDNESHTVAQDYICDKRFPYWLIYRNDFFDTVSRKMAFGIFEVFRDRQLTNARMHGDSRDIRVIKSRNINDDGTAIIDIDGYDAYVPDNIARTLSVYRFLDDDQVYLTPNMSYKPRVIRKPKGVLVNGSAAILSLKAGQPPLTDREMRFFSTDEYRAFYRLARNKQTRSLNVDANSVYFFGRLVGADTAEEAGGR